MIMNMLQANQYMQMKVYMHAESTYSQIYIHFYADHQDHHHEFASEHGNTMISGITMAYMYHDGININFTYKLEPRYLLAICMGTMNLQFPR